MTRQQLIDIMAVKIYVFEGGNLPRSVNNRFNNPGNLRRWGRTPVWVPTGQGDRPATPEERKRGKGYAKFPTIEAGWRALKKQIEKNVFVRGLTMRQFFGGGKGYAGFAPSKDGNYPTKYASYVMEPIGDSIDIPVYQFVTEGDPNGSSKSN